jgi:hypothetical protein
MPAANKKLKDVIEMSLALFLLNILYTCGSIAKELMMPTAVANSSSKILEDIAVPSVSNLLHKKPTTKTKIGKILGSKTKFGLH